MLAGVWRADSSERVRLREHTDYGHDETKGLDEEETDGLVVARARRRERTRRWTLGRILLSRGPSSGPTVTAPFAITHFARVHVQPASSYVPIGGMRKFCLRRIFLGWNEDFTVDAFDMRIRSFGVSRKVREANGSSNFEFVYLCEVRGCGNTEISL